jgi:hypothetical protein
MAHSGRSVSARRGSNGTTFAREQRGRPGEIPGRGFRLTPDTQPSRHRSTRSTKVIALSAWLAFAVELGACATRTIDSTAPDARTADAGSGDAFPSSDSDPADAWDADTQDSDTPLRDSPLEATSDDATGTDADGAPPECAPGQTRECYNLIIPCGPRLETCRLDGTWGGCPCVVCDGPLGVGACAWTEEMADSELVSENGFVAVQRIVEGGGEVYIDEGPDTCTTSAGWYREVSDDGGTKTLTVSLCPALCDEHQTGGVQFVLRLGCMSMDP